MIILGDPIQMHQVIMNLCANAEHAMRENGGLLELKVEHVTGEADNIKIHHRSGRKFLCTSDRSRYWSGHGSGCGGTNL